ncbi:MAG: hypothetical protein PHN56_06505, partial [Candidatus Nanoarchaeia archaeon]|nr:hypothetical protein [Candidatus Nanoarchaeia archaeon]
DYTKKMANLIDKEKLADFCTLNVDILKYYSKSKSENEVMDDFSEFSCKILGIHISNKKAVNTIISSKVSSASNSSEEFNLSKIPEELGNLK